VEVPTPYAVLAVQLAGALNQFVVDQFDYSNSTPPGEKISAMAGYIATVGAWKRFEIRWREFLAKHGIDYLHMKELFAFRGQFENFRDKDCLIHLMRANASAPWSSIANCSSCRSV
jgi:hypothetical protein